MSWPPTRLHYLLKTLIIPPLCQNAHHQATPLQQTQYTFHPQTPLYHQNQHTNPHIYPQNYQTTRNAPSPSVAPHLPRKTTFQIPVPNEQDVNDFELDQYEDQKREWKAKEEAAKIDINEEIRKQ